MCWRTSLGFSLSALAFGVIAQPVRAAEAYLCGTDTIVYVEPQDLELKKRTDPCIAGYYGLTIAPLAASQQPVEVAPKPVIQKSRPRGAAAKLRRLDDADAASPDAPRPERMAAVTAPDTDYRNVRILNPETPGAAWFHHAK